MFYKKFYLKLLMGLLLMAFMAPPAAQADELTVAKDGGDNYGTMVPVYGLYFDSDQTIGQTVYSASDLESMVGTNITKIKFYPRDVIPAGSGSGLDGVVLQVSLKLIDSSQNGLTTIETGLTVCGTHTIARGEDVIEFDFSNNPFAFIAGKNLLVETRVITPKGYGTIYWLGENNTYDYYTSYFTYNGRTPEGLKFIPKTTFTYEASASVSVNPTSLTFGGETFYTGSSENKDVTASNSTDAAVSVTITGDDASMFSVNATSLAAGATDQPITVTYTPTAAGTHTATLNVGDKTVTLTGTAKSQSVDITPASLSFGGDAFLAGSTETKQVTIANNTTAAVTTALALSGDNADLFTVGNDVTVAAGESATVDVTYSPTAAGNHTATLTVMEGKTVALNGTAVAPVISGTVTPASLSFSCQEGATATGTITVENTGNVAFTPAFSGITAPFSIEAATEVAAGASKQFTVTYAPTAAGNHTGTLAVTINGNATNIALSGTAEEAPQTGELTVAESTSTSASNLSRISPIYGGKFETAGSSAWVQTLYPASLISEQLNGKQITKMRFYHNGTPAFTGGVVEVRIGETDATTTSLDSRVAESSLKIVKTITGIATVFDTNNYMTIEFEEPYPYEGGSLVLQTKVITKGTNQSNSYFFGKYANQLGVTSTALIKTGYSNVGTGNGFQTNFLPMTTFTFENKKGVELVSPEDGVLNFGEVSVKGHKTKTITVKNNNSAAVTPSFSELAYPYSVTDAPESIAAGETATISVTMTPKNDTQNTEHNNVALTLTFGSQNIAITINGTSHVNEATMTTEEFSEIEYTWKDENGDTQTSNLAEVATEPAQMVELMREVYMNRNVPGNWYRGYTSAGEPDIEVIYPPIGSIVYGENGYTYNDAYGWNIGFSENVTEHILTNEYNSNSIYKYFNPNEYKPLKNGVTLLLVEMKDNIVHDDGTWTEIVSSITNNKPATYEALCSMFGTIFKSVRVVTQSRRMGAGEEASTLFKLDADKLNRFFLLAKGRLRQFSLDVERQKNSFINASSTSSSYRETEEYGPFYQMYEQLSPVDLGNVSDVTDVYQKLVNMQSYPIHHDCQAIPFMNYNNVVGHEFNMYGKASITDDCQDVRDLMITIPERRMQWWYVSTGSDDSRDGTPSESLMNDMFVSYNKQYVPKMGLFVIKQFPIEGEKQENANVYDLNLSWTSNLLEFLPTGYGVYNLYRVVTNADGTKTYVKVVDNLDPNTYSFVDHIEMQQTGQVVTYVVQGQDMEQFLSLQLSNEESFVVPGLDRKEQLRIALNSDYYFSRYDAATKTNNYSNSIIANNTVGTNVKPEYLAVWQEGSDVGMFKFWRATLKTVNGQQVVDKDNAVNFASCKVTSFNATTGGTLAYVEGDDQTDFSNEVYGHGYHASEATSTISIVDGEVVFDGLKLYDNFRVSVEQNDHPALYVYYVTLKTAVPFALNDEGTETSQDATSNTVSVPVYKTGMTMNTLSEQDVEDDVDHSAPAGTTFDLNARYSSKSEILGYYIYRWADTKTAANARSIYDNNGDDASPQGQAGNQGTYYTVAMNTDFSGRTENFGSDFADVTATFEDNYVFNQAEKGDTYTYAPVVELFAPQQAVELPSGDDREDYNTYGGPQQMSAGGVITIIPGTPCATNNDEFTPEVGTNAACKYYYIPMTAIVDLPNGYDIYKVRAWRQIDTQWLGELEADKDRVSSDYLFETQNDANADDDVLIGVASEDGNVHHHTGLFGAKSLSSGESFDANFIVRVYFTKTSKDGEAKYYIAEKQQTVTITDEIITGIANVKGEKQVAGVKYYNLAGIESDRPFSGVNIVVTRYTDGSTSTSKMLK